MTRRAADRFTISAFPQQVQLDPDFADSTWRTLKHAITEINKRNTSNLSFEQLYRYSYNMVLHKQGDYLYHRLRKLQTDHLNAIAQQVIATESPAFLAELQRQWTWFELSLAHIRDILMYMDRHYIKSKGYKSVYDLGIELFRNIIILNSNVLSRLSTLLLNNVHIERTGESIDVPLMRSITRMLSQLGSTPTKSIYALVFEDEFLQKTVNFYAREANIYFNDSTCSDYLFKASKRLHEEKNRVDAYLEPETLAKVRKVAERELITNYMTKLIEMPNSGFVSMLRNDKLTELRLMYVLFREIESGEEMLKSNLKKEVLEGGTQIIKNPEYNKDPVSLVAAILSLKEKYERILNTSFTLPPSVVTNPTYLNSNSDSLLNPSHVRGIISTSILGGMPSIDGGISGSGIMGVGSTSAGAATGLGIAGEKGPLLFSSAGNTMGSSSSSAAAGCCEGLNSNNSGSNSNTTSMPASSSIIPPVTGLSDKKYVSSVDEAFEKFVNDFPDGAEYVSLYVDKLLRKDFKGSSDDEIDVKLERIMTLFRYLNDKDTFQRYYQQHLTKRLLYNKASSSDVERQFLSKVKLVCGYMYTQKMEVMFNDIKTSEESTNVFRERNNVQSVNMYGVDLNVNVLTTMSWPISQQQNVSVNLPNDIKLGIEKFEQFYYQKHTGRRLTWQNELGTAEVKGRFGKDGNRVYDFTSVPALCVSILVLFNNKESLTFNEILQLTNIPKAELTRHLQSLAMAKYRILKKDTKDRDIKPEDRFYFNEDFSSKNRRIKLQVVSAKKENDSEKSQTKSKIDDDRRPAIDTVIVRIMKNRKTIDHTKLIMEVTEQLSSRFEPDPQEIKKRIESLVEREYLERLPDKRTVYQYVA